MRLNGISCFAGIGGLDLAVREDVRTVCYIEWDKYCQEVLKKRMQEGFLDDAPIWGDIQSFDGRPWHGKVDIVFGGFPCQDISLAGKGAGIKEGTRSGLFYQLIRLIGEIRPRYVFLENVSAITYRGLDVVLGELSKAGYDAKWTDLRASDVGARHRRERWFCLAYTKRDGCFGTEGRGSLEEAILGEQGGENDSFNSKGTSSLPRAREDVAYSELCGCVHGQITEQSAEAWKPSFGEPKPKSPMAYSADSRFSGLQRGNSLNGGEITLGLGSGVWLIDPADFESSSESFVGRVAHGVPKRVDRLKCLGNAVVPQQGNKAWRILMHNENGFD
jgi:DNA (cytosine-5)-methyltransferase 1